MRTATYWINHLRLTRHPEGGYYRETYRSTESVEPAALPARFQGSRSLSTAIYFLLESSQRSVFHRIKSDEVWHFYDGSPVAIFVLRDGGLDTFRLGLSIENNETPQVTI
ncbi:MAG TPA: cupin domain-containing protein, partial [Chryseosolibacter sp.]|nr:cupin domain-containing protein [Chryseosolibacter sp.]